MAASLTATAAPMAQSGHTARAEFDGDNQKNENSAKASSSPKIQALKSTGAAAVATTGADGTANVKRNKRLEAAERMNGLRTVRATLWEQFHRVGKRTGKGAELDAEAQKALEAITHICTQHLILAKTDITPEILTSRSGAIGFARKLRDVNEDLFTAMYQATHAVFSECIDKAAEAVKLKTAAELAEEKRAEEKKRKREREEAEDKKNELVQPVLKLMLTYVNGGVQDAGDKVKQLHTMNPEALGEEGDKMFKAPEGGAIDVEALKKLINDRDSATAPRKKRKESSSEKGKSDKAKSDKGKAKKDDKDDAEKTKKLAEKQAEKEKRESKEKEKEEEKKKKLEQREKEKQDRLKKKEDEKKQKEEEKKKKKEEDEKAKKEEERKKAEEEAAKKAVKPADESLVHTALLPASIFPDVGDLFFDSLQVFHFLWAFARELELSRFPLDIFLEALQSGTDSTLMQEIMSQLVQVCHKDETDDEKARVRDSRFWMWDVMDFVREKVDAIAQGTEHKHITQRKKPRRQTKNDDSDDSGSEEESESEESESESESESASESGEEEAGSDAGSKEGKPAEVKVQAARVPTKEEACPLGVPMEDIRKVVITCDQMTEGTNTRSPGIGHYSLEARLTLVQFLIQQAMKTKIIIDAAKASPQIRRSTMAKFRSDRKALVDEQRLKLREIEGRDAHPADEEEPPKPKPRGKAAAAAAAAAEVAVKEAEAKEAAAKGGKKRKREEGEVEEREKKRKAAAAIREEYAAKLENLKFDYADEVESLRKELGPIGQDRARRLYWKVPGARQVFVQNVPGYSLPLPPASVPGGLKEQAGGVEVVEGSQSTMPPSVLGGAVKASAPQLESATASGSPVEATPSGQASEGRQVSHTDDMLIDEDENVNPTQDLSAARLTRGAVAAAAAAATKTGETQEDSEEEDDEDYQGEWSFFDCVGDILPHLDERGIREAGLATVLRVASWYDAELEKRVNPPKPEAEQPQPQKRQTRAAELAQRDLRYYQNIFKLATKKDPLYWYRL